MKTIITLVLVLGGIISASGGEKELDLVIDSKPESVIVIAKNALDPIREAADDMQNYLYKISGARLKIVPDSQVVKGTRILIGESKYTRQHGYKNSDFKPQEYMIKTVGKDLILMGRDQKDSAVKKINGYSWCRKKYFQQIGSLYAVNSFLEKYCGIQWYMPTEIGEVVPKNKNITIPAINIRRSPSTAFRVMFGYWTISKKLWVWKYANIIQATPPLLSQTEEIQWGRRLKMGGRPFWGNHGQTDYYKRFGKKHPEWFANRTPARGNQLCYSNPAVFKQVVEDAGNFFEHKYNRDGCGNTFCVMPDDTAAWCMCDKCAPQYDKSLKGLDCHNGYASEYVWTFVSKVATEIKKTHPSGVISCAAYWDYCNTPEIDIPNNVYVTICGTRSKDWNDKEKQKRYDFIKKWRKKTRNIIVWDYYLYPQNKTYDRFPMVAPHSIAELIYFLKELKIDNGMMMQMDEYYEKNLVLDHLRIYVSMKLLDDWNADVDDILNEYYKLFYGPAATEMKHFWSELEKIYFYEREKKSPYADAEYDWKVLCPPATIEKLGGIIKRAKAKTPLQSIYRKRVELINEAVYQAVIVGNSNRVMEIIKNLKEIECPRIIDKPEIDGTMNEASWNKAGRALDWTGIGGENIPVSTEARIMYDDNNLYIAYICHDKKGYKPKMKNKTKDVNLICMDDSIELFLIPSGKTTGKRFQIIANSLPAIYDSADGVTAWDSKALVATKVKDGMWTLEMAIPLKSLTNTKIKAGDIWRVNFCRNCQCLPKTMRPFINWSGPDGYSNPSRYGALRFK